MTKRDIIIDVAEKSGQKQRLVKQVLELSMKAIADSLTHGQDVELRNFGVFQVQVRRSRVGRNPNEPAKEMIIPEHAVVKFRVGKALRNRLARAGLVQAGKGKRPAIKA